MFDQYAVIPMAIKIILALIRYCLPQLTRQLRVARDRQTDRKPTTSPPAANCKVAGAAGYLT